MSSGSLEKSVAVCAALKRALIPSDAPGSLAMQARLLTPSRRTVGKSVFDPT